MKRNRREMIIGIFNDVGWIEPEILGSYHINNPDFIEFLKKNSIERKLNPKTKENTYLGTYGNIFKMIKEYWATKQEPAEDHMKDLFVRGYPELPNRPKYEQP